MMRTHASYPKLTKEFPRDWAEDVPDYAPIEYTAKVVLNNASDLVENGWADPAVMDDALREQVAARPTHHPSGQIQMVDGFPRNPFGRTGYAGRGLLGKYGPNHAADPIVTRRDPETGKLQVVVIRRKDDGSWAIPGGMMDPGEHVSRTLKREFMEEARNTTERDQIRAKVDALFDSGGKFVYAGYVEDPRNTDHAWMETCAYHFHIEDADLARSIQLGAGDDAADVKWLDVDRTTMSDVTLYADHRVFIDMALSQLGMDL
jgi:ADP-ribose pyrophosphatase